MKNLFIRAILPAIFFLTAGCADRQPTNPFDPNSGVTLVDLSLQTDSTTIALNWSLRHPVNGLAGFRIYRSAEKADSLELYAETGPDIFQWVDPGLNLRTWYYYQIRAVGGGGIESLPSSRQSAYLGTHRYWVLSRSDFAVYDLSYDLRNLKARYDLAYSPRSWASTPDNPFIWLGYGSFINSISRLTKSSGEENVIPGEMFSRPIGMVAIPGTQRVYVLDDRENDDRLLTYDNGQKRGEMLIPDGEYLGMILSGSGRQLILAENRALYQIPLSAPGQRRDYALPAETRSLDFFSVGSRSYLLSAVDNSQQSRLTRIDSTGSAESSLTFAVTYYRIAYDPRQDRYLAARYIPGEVDRVMDLGTNGGEVGLLPESFVDISQIVVNAEDGSILILDGGNSLISLYDGDRRFISTSRNSRGERYVGTPYRLLIQ